MRKKPISALKRADDLIWGETQEAKAVYNAIDGASIRLRLGAAIRIAIVAHHRAANRLRQRRAKQRKELALTYVTKFGPCFFCEKPVESEDKHFDALGMCKSRKAKV